MRRALRSFLVGLCLTLLAVMGFVGWVDYRPDLLINPIDRFIHTRYLSSRFADIRAYLPQPVRVSMIPDIFSVGEARTDVAARMRDAGYYMSSDQPTVFVFGKEGPGNILRLCSIGFIVIIKVDSQDGLVAAEAQSSGVCA